MWELGTKLIRKHSPELGIGVVVGLDGRFIDVFFPDTLTRMKLSPDPQSIRPLILSVGDVARTPDDTLEKIIAIRDKEAIMESGIVVALELLWPVVAPPTLLERLLSGQTDKHEDVLNRVDGIRLLDYRRQGTLPSLLGGRIELFNHQLDTAQRAIAQGEVRWLLADEVGLGKTIVAHMITSAMLRMNRLERVIVIAPDTLTVQWLGELYRKFHQVFVHIDEERLQDVETDFGQGVNPFEVYPLSVVSFELLAKHKTLLASLNESKPQLVAIDEAHQALHPPYKDTLLPLVEKTRHALLLTASPFQLGAQGFLALASSLRLEVKQTGDAYQVRNVSAVTRADIPKLPARAPVAIDIEAPSNSIEASDPRVKWLVGQLPKWRKEGKKALIFVNNAARAIKLHQALEHGAHMDMFLFHERMETKDRDIELSRFRLSSSPALVSSGAGSEGRNFQFCDILVHVDLPTDPMILEQRIGRLDRIGRQGDIPIYYFRHEGKDSEIAQAYERLGIFADASIGASPAMTTLGQYLSDSKRDTTALDQVLEQVRQDLEHHDAKWSFPDSHNPEQHKINLGKLPDELEQLTERFCVDAAERTGLGCLEKDGQSSYFFEHGTNMLEPIPGIPDDVNYMGTFSREEAIAEPELEFFANGHPLVEGLLTELEDNPKGRIGAVTLPLIRIRLGLREELAPGDYLLAFEGREAVTTPKLYALPGGNKPPETESIARAVIRALERSKPMNKTERQDALTTLTQSEELPGLDLPSLTALILINIKK